MDLENNRFNGLKTLENGFEFNGFQKFKILCVLSKKSSALFITLKLSSLVTSKLENSGKISKVKKP